MRTRLDIGLKLFCLLFCRGLAVGEGAVIATTATFGGIVIKAE